ncbi:WD40-repeat-containing domain protein [Mycena alexandri]|uniref:WD40-repeat-containing domain protein n=1 Tax=Mycena alexandri TaxID=1745969 RepID=A0AAD6SWZ1_9AGAR|nr:WD40-repeat-containing domain protein [Mycena alexandri]
MPYSLHRTLTLPNTRGGLVNAVLFFEDGTRLASGGDDEVLRIWDVRSGDCQEFTDSEWGQITNLTIMLNPAGGETQGLLVGTGRGVVSIYPWHERTMPPPIRWFFLTPPWKARHLMQWELGTVKMYAIRDCRHMVLTWSFSIGSSIPRSLEFMGEENETFVIHTLTTGTVLCCDSRTGELTSESRRLWGGVLRFARGFVTFSADKQQKAVHNLSIDQYELYGPTDSVPFPISPFGTSQKIKGAAFGEGVRNIICGGDNGTIYVYNIPNHEIEQELIQADCGTICALTTCSTRDYHLIASAAGELPAHVYIWGKPTQRRHTENMEQVLERQRFEAQASLDAATLAQSRQEAESLRAELAAKVESVRRLKANVERKRTRKLILRAFLVLSILILPIVVGWVRPDIRGIFTPHAYISDLRSD